MDLTEIAVDLIVCSLNYIEPTAFFLTTMFRYNMGLRSQFMVSCPQSAPTECSASKLAKLWVSILFRLLNIALRDIQCEKIPQ